jgi:hypothetical protein
MIHSNMLRIALVSAAMLAPAHIHAQILVNGGFESGLTGWTRVDQAGSNGTFHLQSGTSSPINGFAVPAPPQGTGAAMTDSTAGGSHVLYQDFIVPVGPIPQANAAFSLYLRNHATTYFNPATLDWAATNPGGGLNLNQQARVDIISTTANVFSVAPADVLQNLFQTTPASPLVSGYDPFVVDITALLLAHQGQTLRLRFAEVDNVNFFNFGVDGASINIIPAPSVLILGLLVPAAFTRRSRRR